MNPLISRVTRLLCAFFVVWVLIAATISVLMLSRAVDASRQDDAVLSLAASDMIRTAIDLRAQGVEETQVLTKLAPQLQRPMVAITLFDTQAAGSQAIRYLQSLVPEHQMFYRSNVTSRDPPAAERQDPGTTARPDARFLHGISDDGRRSGVSV